MIITDNLGSLLTDSLFGWLKDKTMLIYLVIATIIGIIAGVISLFSLNDFVQYMLTLAPDLATKNKIPIEKIIELFNTLSPVITVSIIEGIALFILSYFIIKRGLELTGQKGVNFSISRLVVLFVLEIIAGVVAILSLYRLKWLGVGVLGGILIILGGLLSSIPILGGFFATIGLILIIVYFIIVFINFIRLSLANVVYIEKEREIMESLRISWDLTKDNVLGIFIITIAVYLVTGAISYIASIPSTIFLQSTLIGMANIEGIAGVILAMEGLMSMLTSPVYLILLIPVFIISAYEIIVLTYLFPLIYKLLKEKGKAKSKQKTYHF